MGAADDRKYKESFVFVETMYQFVMRLPDNQRLWMLQSIIEYGLYGTEPKINENDLALWLCFENARASIDSAKHNRKQQSEAGKRSGAARRNKKTNGVRTNVNVNGNVNGNANDNDNVNVNDNDPSLPSGGIPAAWEAGSSPSGEEPDWLSKDDDEGEER